MSKSWTFIGSRKLWRDGQSVSVVLPKDWCSRHNVKRGDFVNFYMTKEGYLVIEKPRLAMEGAQ